MKRKRLHNIAGHHKLSLKYETSQYVLHAVIKAVLR